MKRRKMIIIMFMMICLVSVGVLSPQDAVHAKKITSVSQAEKKALKKVKNAVVTEVEKDYENGKLVYEITLVKGTREYELTYRASNGKLLSYSWEQNGQKRNSNKNRISKSSCKKLAKSKVKKASIQSIIGEYDDGSYIYVIKMKKGSKKYTLEYDAATGTLLEYQWKRITKK